MSAPPWTLDDLAEQVTLALAEGAAPSDGRVRDVPDPRTIRYYTTLGLLDRADSFRGRTALYGRRHLLQLVSIKRLQAQGRSLAEIQASLAGCTDLELQNFAKVTIAQSPASPPPVPRTEFWKASSAIAHPEAINLADGLLLIVTVARPLDVSDRAALQAAAEPLVKLLQSRNLVPSPERSRP